MTQETIATAHEKSALSARDVRVAFIQRGTSLHRWATERGLNSGYVHQIIVGDRRGPGTVKVLRELRRDCGL